MKNRKNILTNSAYLARIRKQNNETLASEYIRILAWLYSDSIDQGKRIRDYEDLTMCDVVEEIKLRTVLLQNHVKQLKDRRLEKQKKEESRLLESLKKRS